VDFCGEQLRVACAGRTDAGVHANGQVVHFDLTANRTPYQVMEGLNFHLRARQQAVQILDCTEVDESFHARFSATGRAYRYVIINRRAPLVLDAMRAWHIGWDLNVSAMQEASQHLLGTHDFTSFRATGCQSKSPIKTLDVIDIQQEGDRIITQLEAKSFLHHQVRIIMGTLALVGGGKWNAQDVLRALHAKDRAAAGPTAPPQGLTLTHVRY
jgi:tRNA pseudouridine38-40 synthase